MILTNCAACAAPLAHDHKKRCSRCKTRYCNEACQRQHWERGGHEALCRRIKRGGGAEQYHADKKYKEAVAVAVEACSDDIDDLLEAATTLEDTERIARRVLGGTHPLTADIEWGLGEARAALRARESPPRGSA